MFTNIVLFMVINSCLLFWCKIIFSHLMVCRFIRSWFGSSVPGITHISSYSGGEWGRKMCYTCLCKVKATKSKEIQQKVDSNTEVSSRNNEQVIYSIRLYFISSMILWTSIWVLKSVDIFCWNFPEQINPGVISRAAKRLQNYYIEGVCVCLSVCVYMSVCPRWIYSGITLLIPNALQYNNMRVDTCWGTLLLKFDTLWALEQLHSWWYVLYPPNLWNAIYP